MEKGKIHKAVNICDLPDEILQAILSNVPTKDAVRTSSLSKRWINQWKMDISTIDLEERRQEKRQQFIQDVERLLEVCELSRVKKFSLVFEFDEDVQQVNQWLCAFINPEIQEVKFEVGRVEQPLVLPNHLFISKTLTKLILCMQNVINLPSSISLLNLKTLTLKGVIFPDGGSTQQLFSSFPSLKELSLIDCNWMNDREVYIACSLLQKLIIREGENEFNDGDANGLNAANKCDIIIIGSNLRTFFYDGDHRNSYFLHDTTLVKDATIGIQIQNGGSLVFKLLNFLKNVEKLSFVGTAMEALCRTYSLLVHLPLFENLVELHVGSSESPTYLMILLRKAPILKVVSFVMGVSLPPNGEHNFGPLPVCFGTHLRTIKIYDFYGNKGDLNVIQFILKNALVLDTIYIYVKGYEFSFNAGPKRLNMMKEQVKQFPKAATNCNIIFE